MSERVAHDEGHRAADRLLVRVGWHGGAWVGVLAIAALVMAAAQTALPFVLGRTVDAVVRGADTEVWLVWAGVIVAASVVCDALAQIATGAATARSTAWLRHALLRHVLAVGTRMSERFTVGDLTSRLVGNAAEAGSVAPNVVRAGASVIPAVGGVVALALIDIWLCLTFLIGLPPLVLVMHAFTRDASEIAGRYLAVQGTIAARLVEAMSGARTIAAAGTVERESERVLAPLPDLRGHGIGMWRLRMRVDVREMLLVSLLTIAVLAVAGAQLARGAISPGEMLAASQYVVLATGLGSLLTFVTQLVEARGAARRVAAVLGERATAYGTSSAPVGGGLIEFRGVTARAGDRVVFEDLNLAVPAGALVAVVGRSGVGKSLLAALAGRLVDPDEGEVLLDGMPLRSLDRRELRRQVGYGFERPALMGETLADVIAFGADTPPPERLVSAARAARADDFIRRLPEAYGTRLAEAPMSGGEVQRVGLARTFAHAGRVLVLDDVAASLDTVTEHHIGRVLTGALADRTRIVVAHRASTAARSDLVVWLDEGGVRAVAPHEELWGDPDYRALFGPEGGPTAAPAELDTTGVAA